MIDRSYRASALTGICLLQALTICGAVAQDLPATFPNHPRLLLNADGVAQLKERIAEVSWAKASWKKLRSETERELVKAVVLPPRGGNWSHNYVCPQHGARLEQGRKIGTWEWEHICPSGHHNLKGDPSKASLDFDGNAISRVHGHYAQLVVDNGLLWQVTGNPRYADKAREILLAYTQAYLAYPLHDNQGRPGKGGHVASQSLSEASWLIDVAQGADLVWNHLSAADRAAVETKILRPALNEIILKAKLGIHNIQCRHNSAIGLVGFLLGDRDLISKAINEPVRGFRQQLAKGVREDGMWTEGASGYHFFTIAGLWPLAEAARNCGIDLYSASFESMFDGPLALAMPNLVLPNFNDSGTVALDKQADSYELAFARFNNPAYVPLIEKSARQGRLALLYGATNLKKSGTQPGAAKFASTSQKMFAPAASRNFPASGYAILQAGKGEEATWLCLKYGPHGGGHGHPDKLTFVLYSHGEIVGTDAGTHAYASSLHKDWDKTTFAHNTLVIDETSQKEATGSCLGFGSDSGVDYCILDAGPIHKDLRLIRTAALLSPELVVFIDQVFAAGATAGESSSSTVSNPAPSSGRHVFDLVYHQTGRWLDSAPAAEWAERWSPPQGSGYSHLTRAALQNLRSGTTTLEARTDRGRQAITIRATEPTELIKGYGLLKSTDDLAPLLIQRRSASATAFVWAISLNGRPALLKTFPTRDEKGAELAASHSLAVQVEAGKSSRFLLINPLAPKIGCLLPDGKRLETRSQFLVRK